MNPQRLDVRYRIAWNGRWHVGSGYQSSVADRLQQRWGGHGGPPFVPGSQMKGILRDQCERLARTLGLNVVGPHSGAEAGDRHLVEHFRPLAKSDLLIDRLFGSRYQGECLFATNALSATAESQDIRDITDVTARTAVDRVTGTAMERRLYTTEYASPEVYLHGGIRARHPEGVLTCDDGEFPFEYTLLVAGMLSLDALGGDKSAGFGRCEISLEPDSLRWNGSSISLDHALRALEEREWADMIQLQREWADMMRLQCEEGVA